MTIQKADLLSPATVPPSLSPLISQAELQARIAELGAEISRDYAGRPLTLVGILKGAFVFMADLCRHISVPVDFDFMAVSSYGAATKSSGVVRIVKDLDRDLGGCHVVIVEDIVSSGLTVSYLRKVLEARRPASLEVCALLVKDEPRSEEIPIKYVGFRIPDVFVVGYGLDLGEKYRNLPYVAVLEQTKRAGKSRMGRK
jgi:hypoxanthine phosphoribosyltransferase